MKNKFLILMFSLLLAVGWTSNASAQLIPAEDLAKRVAPPANQLWPALYGGMDYAGGAIHSHDYSTVMPQKSVPVPMKASTAVRATELTDFNAVKKDISRPGGMSNAPLRAGQELPMATITKAEADQMSYTWTDANGTPHTSAATEVAKDPYQMYELLRFVYTNKDFPGPYYSAYTKNDVRERKVYYGAIEGGWNIGGDALPNQSTTTTITRPVYTSGSVTAASGTSTSSGYTNVPVTGNSYNQAQTNRMIYTAAQLGLQAGDVITSITFYPRNGLNFYGGNVRLSLGNTTVNTIPNGGAVTSNDLTEVAQTGSIVRNTSQTEWTIVFDQPFTYTGNNLLVQINTTAGTSSATSFRGTQLGNNVYQSYYSYGYTSSRTRFLPQASFGYQRESEETVTYNPYNTIGDIQITASNWDVLFRSIILYDENNNVITGWNTNSPHGVVDLYGDQVDMYFIQDWGIDVSYMYRLSGNGYVFGYLACGADNPGTINIPYYLLAGHSSVRLRITAFGNGENPTITVNNFAPRTVAAESLDGTTYEWTITPQVYAHTDYDPDYYLPNKEGYTALVVAVKNESEGYYENYEFRYDNGYFDTKDGIVNYLATHVDSIKLLTDGMRVGEGSDYTIGTLFNCEGTYNKFFFLGKGQARQKPEVVRYREIYNQHILGEEIPFRYMFEQFSPTTGAQGDETTDFYSKMMEGNVYNVQHDCRSVIQLNHQFSMSGNEGTTPYAMTGMNFFIPDYRLKYWELVDEDYTFDGRIMNPYQIVSTDGDPKLDLSLMYRYPVNYAVWYAQYNMQYPPKVGIYKITLDATAEPVAYDYTEGNLNYQVTLTWVSSLNEMSGHEVPQTYTVYYWDPKTGEQKYVVATGVTDGKTGLTTITYLVEQEEHSYTIDYIVHGSPDDADHDQFVAISNVDGVVIPGWNDFVGLQLDHHESDFVVADMANWYRNFLVVVNEDIVNGLTLSQITGYNEADPSSPLTPMNTFNLYRYEYKGNERQPGEIKIATLTFDSPTSEKVHYKVTYEEGQEILASKYQRNVMGVPDQGYVRVKGNGDLVIWPNGYHVNFKSITVKNNGTVVTSWNAETMNTLPSSWIVSPGSKWEEYTTSTTGDKVGYMEGGGYIAIPDMLNNYNNLTVEIQAYGDGAAVTRIAVNDDSKLIANSAGTTYTWGTQTPISPNGAPKRELVTKSVTVNENGTDQNRYVPTWGYFYDYTDQFSEMIFTADQLNLSVGDVLTSVTFYPTVSTLNYSGGSIKVFLGTTNESNFDAGSTIVPDDLAQVASFTPNGINCANGWTINFTSPFTYNGGNLLLYIETEQGTNYTDSYFYGVNTSSSMSIFFFIDVETNQWDGYLNNFQPKATFTYETEEGGDEPPGPDVPTEGSLLRLHLLMVDQLKADIPDNNSHADAYGYVLRYEPAGGEAKESGSVKVNIEKTEAQVNGYYTLDEIDNDVNIGINHDQGITLNVLTADVTMDLPEENPDILYYEMQGKKDNTPALDEDYLTKLQYMKNVMKYEEMLEGSPNKGHQYNANETYHYFDESTPIVTGTYGYSFMSYAPSVSTWGIDRRYFEDDGENNTYGAPIWKTGVGQVQLTNAVHERQTNTWNSVNWTDDGDNACSLYILKDIEAVGYLPHSDVSNVEYEPYMFRVFVESRNGKLRPYTIVPKGDGQYDGEHLEAGTGTTTGPLCIWSGYVNDSNNADKGVSITPGTGDGGQTIYTFRKAKVDRDEISNPWNEYDTIKDPETGEVIDIVLVKDRDAANAMFGALDNLAEIIGEEDGKPVYAPVTLADLNVFVRFYYVAAGTAEGHTPWIVPSTLRAAGEGGAPAGYGAESPGKAPSPWTAVNEVRYVGEIVSQTYYNIQGMVSDKPFDGVNIVVTRYSDGSSSVAKIIR